MNYDPIAEWYDVFVHARKDLAFFVNEAKKARGDVLDLMCGTGRVAIPLLKAKIRLTCLDISPRMLWIFRQKLISKGLFAQTYQMDVVDFTLVNRFNLVLIPSNSLAEIIHKSDRLQVLQRIYEHLKPGGTFICTLQNPVKTKEWANGKIKQLGKFPLPGEQGTLQVLVQPELTPIGDGIIGSQIFERFDKRKLMIEKKTLALQIAVIEKTEFEEMCNEVGFKKVAFFGDYSEEKFDSQNSSSVIWKMRKPRDSRE
jgi:SAM-dependent methyltransferase